MLFSQRNLLAKECEAWCQRNGASLEPVNILAALQSFGVCLDRPIPVSERLPECSDGESSDDVLIFIDDGDAEKTDSISHWKVGWLMFPDDADRYWETNLSKNGEWNEFGPVTHWLPLPPKPEIPIVGRREPYPAWSKKLPPAPEIAPELIESKPMALRNALESGGPIALSAALAAGERVEIKLQDDVADNYSVADLIDQLDNTRFAIQKFHELLCNQSLKQA